MTDLKSAEIALRLHNERRRIKHVEEDLDAYEDISGERLIDLRITLSRIVVAISEIVEDMKREEPQHEHTKVSER